MNFLEISMTPSPNQDELIQMLDDIEQRSSKLSDWETTFIDSVMSQMPARALSARQIEIITEIWERVT